LCDGTGDYTTGRKYEIFFCCGCSSIKTWTLCGVFIIEVGELYGFWWVVWFIVRLAGRISRFRVGVAEIKSVLP
jgi:hypothetical protein